MSDTSIVMLISVYMTIALLMFISMNFFVSGNIENNKTGKKYEVGTPMYILIISVVCIFWPVLLIKNFIERSFK